MVLHFLLNPSDLEKTNPRYRKKARSSLSRTSLVCRDWCNAQRPHLFADLELRSSADAQFLCKMLRNATDGRLPAAIKSLEFRHGASLIRSCRLLVGNVLPSLSLLSLSSYSTPHPEMLGPSLRPLFTRCQSLRQLELWGVRLFSISALVHLVGDMTNLEELELHDVSWVRQLDQPPSRVPLSCFRSLRRICGNISDPWMLIWLFAPTLARRCDDPPRDIISSNSDIGLLILLAMPFYEARREGHIEILYDAGTCIFPLRRIASQVCDIFRCQ